MGGLRDLGRSRIGEIPLVLGREGIGIPEGLLQLIDVIVELLEICQGIAEVLSLSWTLIEDGLFLLIVIDYLIVFSHHTDGIRDCEECEMRGIGIK